VCVCFKAPQTYTPVVYPPDIPLYAPARSWLSRSSSAALWISRFRLADISLARRCLLQPRHNIFLSIDDHIYVGTVDALDRNSFLDLKMASAFDVLRRRCRPRRLLSRSAIIIKGALTSTRAAATSRARATSRACVAAAAVAAQHATVRWLRVHECREGGSVGRTRGMRGARDAVAAGRGARSLRVREPTHGVMTIEDVVHDDRTRLLDEEGFRARWPALAAESHVYAEVNAAIPPEWMAAIARGTTSAEIGEEAWWQDERGDYWRHSTTNPEKDDEEPPVRMAQRYVREDGTPRVRAATESAVRAEHAPPKEDMSQCCVEPVRLNSATSPDWEGGDAKALRRARDERWSHTVAAADIRTSHEPLQELGYRPRGLRERQVVAADSMCNRHVREMLGCAQPQMPRAWDCREKDERYARWYPGLNPTDFTARVSRLFRDARHACVPPFIHDVLYRILVSGCTNGHRAAARHQTCAKCEHPAMETTTHRFATCQPVAALWVEVITRWNAATTEELCARDLRTTLLGDRGEEENHALTETLWRIVHAATIWTIHQATKAAQDHPGHPKPTASKMLAACES